MIFEPLILIWGKPLNMGQSFTLRIAIDSFFNSLRSEGLGDDEMGKKMTAAHLENLKSIMNLINGSDTKSE